MPPVSVPPETQPSGRSPASEFPARRSTAALRAESRMLPLSAPDLNDEEIRELTETLRSSWLSSGAKVRQFEQQFARLVGVKHAIAVNHGATAFRLALRTIGLAAGDEVIMSPFAPVVAAELAREAGAIPKFVDITERGLHLSPDLIAGTLTDRTRAVLVSHVAGLPAEMDEILAIARRHRVLVIEDAGQALPATYQHQMVGGLGDVACFTFFASKALSLGEGGVMCTNQSALAESCRLLSMTPWSLVSPRSTGPSVHDFSVKGAGTNPELADPFAQAKSSIATAARKNRPPVVNEANMLALATDGFQASMNELTAALGLAQLRKLTAMWQRRREIAATYNAAFSRCLELQCPADRTDSQHAWHSYLLRLNLQRLRITRNQFLEELRARNIGASVLPPPLHLQSIYSHELGYQPESCPVATQEYARQISLPIYSRMTDEDMQRVIDAVEGLVKRFRALPNQPR